MDVYVYLYTKYILIMQRIMKKYKVLQILMNNIKPLVKIVIMFLSIF